MYPAGFLYVFSAIRYATEWKEERQYYLSKAEAHYAELFDDEGPLRKNFQYLTGLYERVAGLPQELSRVPELLSLRARILVLLAYAPNCLQEDAEAEKGNCCPMSLTKSAAGCVSKALSLARLRYFSTGA